MSLCVVIEVTEDSSEEDLMKTLHSLKEQPRTSENILVAVWCTVCKFSLEPAQQLMRSSFHIIHHKYSLFDDVESSLSFIDKLGVSSILHCVCGVMFKSSFIPFVLRKRLEYELENERSHSVLSSFGIRLFPHSKTDSLKDGVHYKFYNDTAPDRAIHLFTPDLCLISTKMLLEISLHKWSGGSSLQQLGYLWCSYVIGSMLNESIWKIKIDSEVDMKLSHSTRFLYPCEKVEQFNELYSLIYTRDWPKGISKTPCEDLYPDLSPAQIWDKGFGGVNMSSEPASELDFAAISSYGVKVVRIGAVADAKDLNYLIKLTSKTFDEDSHHCLQVLPRLRRALIRIGSFGLKSIITLTDLPGCPFQSGPSMEFWESDLARVRAAKFWGLLAQNLVDLSDVVMGYDLINEPYAPDDTDYFGDITLKYTCELHHFYSEALQEIRRHDANVAVILGCLGYASPRAMKTLVPFKDPKVIYSFHMYTPPNLTLRAFRKHSNCFYPGPVHQWSYCPYDVIDISYDFLRSLLKETVFDWQKKHGISSNQILVGEFGISREVPGAALYLRDVVKIFSEHGWNWLLFSFRDEEWDSLDYELGPDLNNMLYRSPTDLFLTVAKHFH